MFKSVFAKYVTAVMTIFVIGFIVLMVVLASIVGNAVSVEKSENMDEVATAVRFYTESAVGDGCKRHHKCKRHQYGCHKQINGLNSLNHNLLSIKYLFLSVELRLISSPRKPARKS